MGDQLWLMTRIREEEEETASVPIIVLLYNGPLLCGVNVLISD